MNPVSELNEYLTQNRSLGPMLFEDAGRDGPPHMPTFVYRVVVGERIAVGGQGSTKAQAKQLAAKEWLRLHRPPVNQALQAPSSNGLPFQGDAAGLGQAGNVQPPPGAAFALATAVPALSALQQPEAVSSAGGGANSDQEGIIGSGDGASSFYSGAKHTSTWELPQKSSPSSAQPVLQQPEAANSAGGGASGSGSGAPFYSGGKYTSTSELPQDSSPATFQPILQQPEAANSAGGGASGSSSGAPFHSGGKYTSTWELPQDSLPATSQPAPQQAEAANSAGGGADGSDNGASSVYSGGKYTSTWESEEESSPSSAQPALQQPEAGNSAVGGAATSGNGASSFYSGGKYTSTWESEEESSQSSAQPALQQPEAGNGAGGGAATSGNGASSFYSGGKYTSTWESTQDSLPATSQPASQQPEAGNSAGGGASGSGNGTSFYSGGKYTNLWESPADSSPAIAQLTSQQPEAEKSTGDGASGSGNSPSSLAFYGGGKYTSTWESPADGAQGRPPAANAPGDYIPDYLRRVLNSMPHFCMRHYQAGNYIGVLNDGLKKTVDSNKLSFAVKSCGGLGHVPQFVVELTVNDRAACSEPCANKADARQAAAKEWLRVHGHAINNGVVLPPLQPQAAATMAPDGIGTALTGTEAQVAASLPASAAVVPFAPPTTVPLEPQVEPNRISAAEDSRLQLLIVPHASPSPETVGAPSLVAGQLSLREGRIPNDVQHALRALGKTPMALLTEWTQEESLRSPPFYKIRSESHLPMFIATVSVEQAGDKNTSKKPPLTQSLRAEGEPAMRRQLAKQIAAAAWLAKYARSWLQELAREAGASNSAPHPYAVTNPTEASIQASGEPSALAGAVFNTFVESRATTRGGEDGLNENGNQLAEDLPWANADVQSAPAVPSVAAAAQAAHAVDVSATNSINPTALHPYVRDSRLRRVEEDKGAAEPAAGAGETGMVMESISTAREGASSVPQPPRQPTWLAWGLESAEEEEVESTRAPVELENLATVRSLYQKRSEDSEDAHIHSSSAFAQVKESKANTLEDFVCAQGRETSDEVNLWGRTFTLHGERSGSVWFYADQESLTLDVGDASSGCGCPVFVSRPTGSAKLQVFSCGSSFCYCGAEHIFLGAAKRANDSIFILAKRVKQGVLCCIEWMPDAFKRLRPTQSIQLYEASFQELNSAAAKAEIAAAAAPEPPAAAAFEPPAAPTFKCEPPAAPALEPPTLSPARELNLVPLSVPVGPATRRGKRALPPGGSSSSGSSSRRRHSADLAGPRSIMASYDAALSFLTSDCNDFQRQALRNIYGAGAGYFTCLNAFHEELRKVFSELILQVPRGKFKAIFNGEASGHSRRKQLRLLRDDEDEEIQPLFDLIFDAAQGSLKTLGLDGTYEILEGVDDGPAALLTEKEALPQPLHRDYPLVALERVAEMELGDGEPPWAPPISLLLSFFPGTSLAVVPSSHRPESVTGTVIESESDIQRIELPVCSATVFSGSFVHGGTGSSVLPGSGGDVSQLFRAHVYAVDRRDTQRGRNITPNAMTDLNSVCDEQSLFVTASEPPAPAVV